MKVKELLQEWEKRASIPLTAKKYNIKLPVSDAARIMALAEIYPARTETQIIWELLTAAIDELEASFPYIQGERVIAEDEYGDPIYEDVGLTPRFHELAKKYARKLAAERTGRTNRKTRNPHGR